MEKTDILIIGGGPAGLTLAKWLGEKGVSSIVLEEHDKFFMKACGEAIIKEDFGFKITDEIYGSKVGLENRIDALDVYYNSECIHKMEGQDNGYILDKRKFENELARMARKNAEIRMGQRVTDIERVDGGFVVKPHNIRCRCLVGCDGTLSITRKFFGERLKKIMFAVEGSEPKTEEDHRLKIYFGKDVLKQGYAWRFPSKNKYNVGTGSLIHDEVMPAFKRLFKGDARGAFIPGCLPCKTYFKGGILIGDAGGVANAMTGGGIPYSLVGSYLAADVLAKILKSGKEFSEENLKEYEILWRKAMWEFISEAYRSQRIAVLFGIYNNKFLLKLVLNLVQKLNP